MYQNVAKKKETLQEEKNVKRKGELEEKIKKEKDS